MNNVVHQKTIEREGHFEGIGLHTGARVSVTLKPAPVGNGIRFFRNGKELHLLGKDSLDPRGASLRCSAVGPVDDPLLTVEHFLAACAGLLITNLTVLVSGPELPNFDGSAYPFTTLLKGLGIQTQSAPRDVYKITAPIFVHDDHAAICVYPAQDLSLAYVLDYPGQPHLQGQLVDFRISPEVFEKELAPARTFCTEDEVDELKRRGLGKGAKRDNTVVVSRNGSHLSGLRFPDECSRHKALDLLGDLSLLGFAIEGRVVGIRSGHALNRRLAYEIMKQRGAMNAKSQNPKSKVIESDEIKKILPHRYPFLLVDRILEMGDMKAVGIKNVTANEPFFQGHFPERAVMPGVLMVEAIAQAAGVLILTKTEHQGKLAFLIGLNNVRFRRNVVPGDQLRLEVEITKLKSKVGVVQGFAKVGEELACEAEIMFTFAE